MIIIQIAEKHDVYDTAAFLLILCNFNFYSAPGAPRDLRVYPVNSSAIQVLWQDPGHPTEKITSYTVRHQKKLVHY